MKIKDKVLKEGCGKFESFSGWCGVSRLSINPFSTNKEVFICKRCKILAEVGKVINEERKLVRQVCLGLAHPSENNQKKFSRWLQNTVNFHLGQVKQKLGIKCSSK